ncbi:Mut7-C RNAse domain-containing protein [Thermococcus henrietii]|uniref:Mut7-C RNAse domain-containing protein n=1 Tax=Thermococcus henrietii TaxID=2016361 RepID=UPI000C06B4FC|nr:Mut7-C RNAse domain-containing protein [Thermococcus henrietii]
MKFIADMMLGRLARWLRLYGYDTLYGIEDDDEIIEVAQKEGRVVLTKDVALARRAERLGAKAFLLRSNSLEGQVEELKRLGVQFEELFPANARCPKCNGPIKAVPKEAVKGKVPPGVYEDYNEFYVCQNCGQIYWPGKQWREMLKMDKKLRGQ